MPQRAGGWWEAGGSRMSNSPGSDPPEQSRVWRPTPLAVVELFSSFFATTMKGRKEGWYRAADTPVPSGTGFSFVRKTSLLKEPPCQEALPGGAPPKEIEKETNEAHRFGNRL